MTREPSVSVTELLAEINNGTHYTDSPDTRIRLNKIIRLMESKVIERKLSAPKKIRNPKTKAKLYTLEEWEKLWCGKLDVPLMDTWATEKNLCKRQLAQLIEEFRTEMISKNKMYADFKAAFQVYLTKGYLSKKMDQIKAPAQTNKWGTQTGTRGLSL